MVFPSNPSRTRLLSGDISFQHSRAFHHREKLIIASMFTLENCQNIMSNFPFSTSKLPLRRYFYPWAFSKVRYPLRSLFSTAMKSMKSCDFNTKKFSEIIFHIFSYFLFPRFLFYRPRLGQSRIFFTCCRCWFLPHKTSVPLHFSLFPKTWMFVEWKFNLLHLLLSCIDVVRMLLSMSSPLQ